MILAAPALAGNLGAGILIAGGAFAGCFPGRGGAFGTTAGPDGIGGYDYTYIGALAIPAGAVALVTAGAVAYFLALASS